MPNQISGMDPTEDRANERALLACCTTNAALTDELLGDLPLDAFLWPDHRTAYTAIMNLRERGDLLDPLLIWREVRRMGMAEPDLNWFQALAADDRGPALGYVYAQAVQSAFFLRRIDDLAKRTIVRVRTPGITADEVLAELNEAAAALSDGMSIARSELITVQDSLDQVLQSLTSGAVPGTMTGFRDLDHITGGYHMGDYWIVAARPGNGKSSLAMSLALRAAPRIPVFVGSFEMSHQSLTTRLLSTVTGIDSNRIRMHTLGDDDQDVLLSRLDQFQDMNLTIWDRAGVTIEHTWNRVRAWRQRHSGPALVILDYIGLLSSQKRTEGRVQEVGRVSRLTKAIAREFDVQTIALSQLNRAVEGRQNHVPQLSDLRESGDLEQDADLVMFIYREELYDQNTDKKGVAELHIAKHRNGPLGVIPVRFDARTTSFDDLTYRSPEGY